MSFTINAFNHQEWERHDLAHYGDFADMISECEMGENAFSGYGRWFFIPCEPLPNGDRVIYFGSWSNENRPGASSYTYAEVFGPEDTAEYEARATEWESQPEWDEEVEEDKKASEASEASETLDDNE